MSRSLTAHFNSFGVAVIYLLQSELFDVQDAVIVKLF